VLAGEKVWVAGVPLEQRYECNVHNRSDQIEMALHLLTQHLALSSRYPITITPLSSWSGLGNGLKRTAAHRPLLIKQLSTTAGGSSSGSVLGKVLGGVGVLVVGGTVGAVL
jgi:hypothetical protein